MDDVHERCRDLGILGISSMNLAQLTPQGLMQHLDLEEADRREEAQALEDFISRQRGEKQDSIQMAILNK